MITHFTLFRRCKCLSSFAITCLLLLHGNIKIADAQSPNILVIELDDARYNAFQPNGGPAFFNTPSINRIAEEGVNFKYMGATTALCVPSRASIYTGLYAHHHGALDNGTSPKPGLTYVSSILQDAGYYTGFVGKWLLGKKLPDDPIGFDYWAVTDEDDHIDPPIRFNDGSTTNYVGHDAVVYTNIALNFLQNEVPSGQPWMLFLFHRVPHLPYEPMSSEDSLYQFAPVTLPANFKPYQENFPSYLYPGHEFEGDSADLEQSIRDNYETCHAAEHSVDRILNYLDSTHMLNNTLVIFSSDNGYFIGEHDLEKKSLSYDEALRVPLFIRYPAWFPPGTVVDNEFAANIDIAPTLLEAAGIPDTFDMDGVSLRKLAMGQVHRKDFFLENYTNNGNNWEAVRSLNYAYIYSYCTSLTEEFFDMTVDPQQNNNLITDPGYATLIQQFRLKRDSLRNATGDTIFPALQNCSLVSEFYADQDDDGYGNPEIFARATTAPSGYVSNYDDCNDSPTGGALIHPGAPELANGLDDNCNGLTDEWSTFYADADGDGFGNVLDTIKTVECPPGFVSNHTDCNDNPAFGGAAIHPGATEIINGIDDDCNGMTDEVLVFQDADLDGYGNPAMYAEAGDSLPGYVANNTDCNDNAAAIHPGVTDICNYIDDNCNGQTDENATIATISPEGIISVCNSTDVTFTANTGTGINYQWLKNGSAINGATNSTYTTTKKGNYQVTETNGFNCISTSQSTNLSTLTKPAATITALGDLNICLTGSVKLQANGGSGLTYQWKKGSDLISGATKKNYTANSKGTYKVIVTKTNGCDKISDGVKVTNLCKETALDAPRAAELLSIYPNPASKAFMLYLSLDESLSGAVLITVQNTMGQEMYSKKENMLNGVLLTEIDPGLMVNGIYFVKVKLTGDEATGENKEWLRTVVYQH